MFTFVKNIGFLWIESYFESELENMVIGGNGPSSIYGDKDSLDEKV